MKNSGLMFMLVFLTSVQAFALPTYWNSKTLPLGKYALIQHGQNCGLVSNDSDQKWFACLRLHDSRRAFDRISSDINIIKNKDAHFGLAFHNAQGAMDDIPQYSSVGYNCLDLTEEVDSISGAIDQATPLITDHPDDPFASAAFVDLENKLIDVQNGMLDACAHDNTDMLVGLSGTVKLLSDAYDDILSGKQSFK